MKNTRKLALKREIGVELADAELREIAGGTRQTMFSCLTYISCNPLECLISRYGQICLEN